MKRWKLSYTDACGCCSYTLRFKTRREARSKRKRLKGPIYNIAGKLTKLVRSVGSIRGGVRP